MAKKTGTKTNKLEDGFLEIARVLGQAAVRVDQAVQHGVKRFWLLELGRDKAPTSRRALGPGPKKRSRRGRKSEAPRAVPHDDLPPIRNRPREKKKGAHSLASRPNSGLKRQRGVAKQGTGPSSRAQHSSHPTGSNPQGRVKRGSGRKGGLIVKEMEGFAALKNGEIDRVIEMDVHAVLRESRDLDRIKKVRTRAALDDLLRGSQATRAGALEAFRDLGPAVAPVLLASLGKVPREAGAELVKCLVETMDSAQLPSLLAHLLENGDLQQRMIALAAVRRVKPASGRALLAKACQDPSAVIRRRVITCLSWYRTPWAIGLIKELAYDEDAGVRSAASEISALVSRIGNTNRIERA